MNTNYCLWVFLLMLFNTVYGLEPLPANLINLSSQTGVMLLKEDSNENALKLLAHFTTQKTVTYCGVASAVMVLNAVGLAMPIDSKHTPYRYFNQDDFFNAQVNKIITSEEVQKKGMSLTKLSKVMLSYGLQVKPFYANQLTLKKFRMLLKNALAHHQFIIINFLRTELHQEGGGHHSPIAAYDEQTDRFLLLDVARYKYPAYWAKTRDLWQAMHTMDGNHYRGFIIIAPSIKA